MVGQIIPSWLNNIARRPSLWLISILLVLITIIHYSESVEQLAFLGSKFAELDLDRHAFERIFYLIPIIWAGFLFGWKGGVPVSLIALACMLPRAIIISSFPRDALVETSAVFIVGNLVAFSFDSLRKEREHRIRLAVLNNVAGEISKSLDLNQILGSSINNILKAMKVDAAMIFLLQEETGELSLAAYDGISEHLARDIRVLKLDEGFNGMVARTGKPAFIEDTSKDSRLTRMTVREEKIKSQLIVPLKAKGGIVGTLSVAVYTICKFKSEEVETLTAIGNQIGVAVENSRLYAHEKKVVEELRASEERYRELFENAHDSIWIQDMDGNITTANKACTGLTGYETDELSHINIRRLFTEESLRLAKEIQTRLLRDEPIMQPYEQRIITKQGHQAILKLTTSVVRVQGKPVGFQYIARDITQEKHLEENLRFYLRQITIAQEEERNRVARELHDETIQALIALTHQLDDITSDVEDISEEKRLVLEYLRQQTSEIITGVRHLSQDLRPPTLDRLGLLPALKSLASDIENRSGITVKVILQGSEQRLPGDAELLLFRIIQEALSNVWRHSQGTEADVLININDNKIKITVTDNGTGFSLPATTGDLVKDGRLGLAGMQERINLIGGTFNLESVPGSGTTVTIEAPI